MLIKQIQRFHQHRLTQLLPHHLEISKQFKSLRNSLDLLLVERDIAKFRSSVAMNGSGLEDK